MDLPKVGRRCPEMQWISVLCTFEYCGTPTWLVKMQTKWNKYKDNRKKPRIYHVAGSKTFYKAKNDLKKKGMNHDLPETWKETHDSQKRKCWTDGAEDAYDKLKQLKDQSMESGSTPKSDEGSHAMMVAMRDEAVLEQGDGGSNI